MNEDTKMTKTYNIALLPGDGIGPDVVNEAVKVLNVIEKISNVKFNYEKHLIGGVSIEKHDKPVTDEVLKACEKYLG